MKFYLSHVRTHGIPPIQCIRNVKEISYVLGKGNTHEIVPYTVSRNFQEMYKFHVVRNVQTMNRKCNLSYAFLWISQPRKFLTEECMEQLVCISPLIYSNSRPFSGLTLQWMAS